MSGLDAFALGILEGRHIATLASLREDGSIHLTAVWFMFQDGSLYVATSSSSRQCRNVEARPTASLMIDTRKPGFESGLTASGTAETLRGEDGRELARRIHARYLTAKAFSDAEIAGFFESYDDVVIRLSPGSWVSWDMGRTNIQFFGGKLSTESGYLSALDG
jgi:PPOX class probable F420-dependent enzyme